MRLTLHLMLETWHTTGPVMTTACGRTASYKNRLKPGLEPISYISSPPLNPKSLRARLLCIDGLAALLCMSKVGLTSLFRCTWLGRCRNLDPLPAFY